MSNPLSKSVGACLAADRNTTATFFLIKDASLNRWFIGQMPGYPGRFYAQLYRNAVQANQLRDGYLQLSGERRIDLLQHLGTVGSFAGQAKAVIVETLGIPSGALIPVLLGLLIAVPLGALVWRRPALRRLPPLPDLRLLRRGVVSRLRASPAAPA